MSFENCANSIHVHDRSAAYFFSNSMLHFRAKLTFFWASPHRHDHERAMNGSTLLRHNARHAKNFALRASSTVPVTVSSGPSSLNELFAQEYNDSKRSINKFIVKARNAPTKEFTEFLMNRGASTPADVARHISYDLGHSSLLSLMKTSSDEPTLVSLHEPLRHECELDFINFSIKDEHFQQELKWAFFRSACVLLNAAHSEALRNSAVFKDMAFDEANGWFSVTAEFSKQEKDWVASHTERVSLATFVQRTFINRSAPFEVLRLPAEQVQDVMGELSEKYIKDGKVLLCRMGSQVLPIDGPVIANAGQIGHFMIAASVSKNSTLRTVGVALPATSSLPAYALKIILDNVKSHVRL